MEVSETTRRATFLFLITILQVQLPNAESYYHPKSDPNDYNTCRKSRFVNTGKLVPDDGYNHRLQMVDVTQNFELNFTLTINKEVTGEHRQGILHVGWPTGNNGYPKVLYRNGVIKAVWKDDDVSETIKMTGYKLTVGEKYKLCVRLWRNTLFLHIHGLFRSDPEEPAVEQVISGFQQLSADSIEIWSPGIRKNNWGIVVFYPWDSGTQVDGSITDVSYYSLPNVIELDDNFAVGKSLIAPANFDNFSNGISGEVSTAIDAAVNSAISSEISDESFDWSYYQTTGYPNYPACSEPNQVLTTSIFEKSGFLDTIQSFPLNITLGLQINFNLTLSEKITDRFDRFNHFLIKLGEGNKTPFKFQIATSDLKFHISWTRDNIKKNSVGWYDLKLSENSTHAIKIIFGQKPDNKQEAIWISTDGILMAVLNIGESGSYKGEENDISSMSDSQRRVTANFYSTEVDFVRISDLQVFGVSEYWGEAGNEEAGHGEAENEEAEKYEAENEEVGNGEAENGEAENDKAENEEVINGESENEQVLNEEAENEEAENHKAEHDKAQNEKAENDKAENEETGNGEAQNLEAENQESEVRESPTFPDNCYRDTAVRDLAHSLFIPNGLPDSIVFCRSACGALGYKYAGIQATSQCFCGNSYGKHGKASNSDCNRVCQDESETNICGGSWRNNVYSATGED